MRPGTKVICINDDFVSDVPDAGIDARIKLFEQLPRKNEKYTVRDIFTIGSTKGITVEELKNPMLDNGIEANFNINRFRKLEETPLEIVEEELELVN